MTPRMLILTGGRYYAQELFGRVSTLLLFKKGHSASRESMLSPSLHSVPGVYVVKLNVHSQHSFTLFRC